jgi:hypothetical protein
MCPFKVRVLAFLEPNTSRLDFSAMSSTWLRRVFPEFMSKVCARTCAGPGPQIGIRPQLPYGCGDPAGAGGAGAGTELLKFWMR